MQKPLLAAAVILLLTGTAEARGKCDGFQRCRCGVTAARKAGLPLNYNGHNLKRAVEFKHALPRAARPAVGVIVYQVGGGPSGHVSTIVAYTGGCMATVYDDAGTYERNICIRRPVYLDASGNRLSLAPRTESVN